MACHIFTPQKSEETKGNAITQPRSHPIKKMYVQSVHTWANLHAITHHWRKQ